MTIHQKKIEKLQSGSRIKSDFLLIQCDVVFNLAQHSALPSLFCHNKTGGSGLGIAQVCIAFIQERLQPKCYKMLDLF